MVLVEKGHRARASGFDSVKHFFATLRVLLFTHCIHQGIRPCLYPWPTNHHSEKPRVRCSLFEQAQRSR
jgi:hypothetical protein